MRHSFGLKCQTARQLEYWDFILAGAKVTSVLLPLWIARQKRPSKPVKYVMWGYSLWRLWELLEWSEEMWESGLVYFKAR